MRASPTPRRGAAGCPFPIRSPRSARSPRHPAPPHPDSVAAHKPPAEKQLPLWIEYRVGMANSNVLDSMRQDWNERAREDPHYYVAFGRRDLVVKESLAT